MRIKGILENKTRTELEKVKAENLEKRKEFRRVPTTREILAKEADVELLEEFDINSITFE